MLASLTTDLAASGLDLVAPFPRSAVVGGDPAVDLPRLGRRDPLCVLVANSRALWPRFVEAMRRGEPSGDHPLDRWVAVEVRRAVAATGVGHELYFSWDAPPRRLPFQHIAHRCGLGHLAPSHLIVHPVVGPWLGLRAVVVFDLEADVAVGPAPDPCASCHRPCLDALSVAMEGHVPSHGDPGDWEAWARLRTVCPQGREHAYSRAQLAYHHTHDAAILARELVP